MTDLYNLQGHQGGKGTHLQVHLGHCIGQAQHVWGFKARDVKSAWPKAGLTALSFPHSRAKDSNGEVPHPGLQARSCLSAEPFDMTG